MTSTVKLVGKTRAIAFGSKPPTLTRNVRIGLGTGLLKTNTISELGMLVYPERLSVAVLLGNKTHAYNNADCNLVPRAIFAYILNAELALGTRLC